MYIFNRITVNPQLPKRISKLNEIANNLWWSWNSEFLKLFKDIDRDLWETVDKNPVKFLKLVSQEKLENATNNQEFLKKYDKIASDFDGYMNSKYTWFEKKFPNNENDLIAYFSAEYGLDQILPIYSGGLGILSGDHLKSASDLGLPFVAVGLLYKNGYFNQKINMYGQQESEYKNIDLYNLPILPVKNENNEEMIIDITIEERQVYLKIWQINVGRIKLYLMDSDIPQNNDDDKIITLRLYGGNQEMRIKQEIVLGMAGAKLLKSLGLTPSLYHMNEGHSSFLLLELIKSIMEEKQVSFGIAREIATSKTVFTTHTPVPAGNDIFPLDLMDKYFRNFWEKLGLDRDEFLKLGMKPNRFLDTGFNMGILALKISGKKNGVSKLHGAVSRQLFAEVWPSIAPDESPITYVTNGIHTCTWLANNLKELYNKYLIPYWQDNMHSQYVWEKINDIPNEMLWKEHMERKESLLKFVKQNVTDRLKNSGVSYDEIKEITSKLNPNALTIGFARRFATYKRATLLFKDLERITQILNDESRPVQIIFAGKAHPADVAGQDLIKYIHEISMKPQFKGKIFLLENYSMAVSRLLVSGVDVWLNNPRRPMEASGTSGQKASVNGVINFSVLDGWWDEGYNGNNGWTIGTKQEYDSYELQDRADSEDIYKKLENKIIPLYYEKDENGMSEKWVKMMKESIISTGAKFGMARQVVDYTEKLYMPLINLSNEYFKDLQNVIEFNEWKRKMKNDWNNIAIMQGVDNLENAVKDAGDTIEVTCSIKLNEITKDDVTVEVYYGKILDNGIIEKIQVIPMSLANADEIMKEYVYKAKLKLVTGGNFGYTFRVMPKNKMILDSENLNLVKWLES